ncbi:Lrp/AsnC family transcriptional regulator [Halomarina halobia]|uniref:Lrp/AsnC family transcriptional regulator n=1 Tax=Halomarina halobia TaxID=3033386 RepID=A0ABD6AFF3_9EURY|nr:Lrp/AsnC family transcriptional regulator [Halomarina sp. PSR21]
MSRSTVPTGNFDEIDLKLLERIEGDFDVSLNTLSDELGLSKSAIHYRLNKLKEGGVVKGITADLDPEPFGLEMVAITEISVTHEHGYSRELGSELAELDGVEQVYYTMGDVDFVAISRVQDRTQMNEVIESMVAIEGVNETSSRFVMNEILTNPKITSNMSTEMKQGLVNDS